MAPEQAMAGVEGSPDHAAGMAAVLQPRTDALVEEITHDEVVLIDLNTSAAYTLAGPGLEVWKTIRIGCSPRDAVEAVSSRYSGSPDQIQAGVEALINRLLEEELIHWTRPRQRAENNSRLSEEQSHSSTLPPFQTPILTKFEGLEGDVSMMQRYALRFG